MMVTQMTRNATLGSGWFKSSYSFANGNCVEVQFLTDGGVQVRNSKDPDGPVLTFTREEWEAFIGGVRLGEFDLGDDGTLASNPKRF